MTSRSHRIPSGWRSVVASCWNGIAGRYKGRTKKVGSKDPKWDEKAREAFDLAARAFSKQVDPVVSPADFHVPAKAAVDAGCDDPLLIYLFHRSALGKEYPGQEESTRRMKAAAKALSTSRYPVFRRATRLELAGSYLLGVPQGTKRCGEGRSTSRLRCRSGTPLGDRQD